MYVVYIFQVFVLLNTQFEVACGYSYLSNVKTKELSAVVAFQFVLSLIDIFSKIVKYQMI